jgi:hypothetical protein
VLQISVNFDVDIVNLDGFFTFNLSPNNSKSDKFINPRIYQRWMCIFVPLTELSVT